MFVIFYRSFIIIMSEFRIIKSVLISVFDQQIYRIALGVSNNANLKID